MLELLLQQGFDMYVGDLAGRTGFHLACFMGSLNVVEFLLRRGFDMYVGDLAGRTGFHLACLTESLNVVQFLLQEGFDMYTGNALGRTGFHAACFLGSLNVIQFLLQRGFDMYVSDGNEMTGFHIACLGGKLNPFLIQQGFNTEQENTDAHHIGCPNGNLNVVQFLLKQGFDMNVTSNNGGTGFHMACICGNFNVVQFLLQQGFDMNIGDNEGYTGFHVACLGGNLNIIRFLLQHGFENVNVISEETGLDILIENRYDHIDDQLYMSCVLLLIEVGGKLSENVVFEELSSAIQNRIIEITFVKNIIFEKWTGRIAELIADFTMDPFTDMSLENLSESLDHDDHTPTRTICSLF